MLDLRAVITESMNVHGTRRFWSYSGLKNFEHEETHENGVVCMCRWAHVSNETGVCGPAYEAHRADMLANALVDAGFVVDDRLPLPMP